MSLTNIQIQQCAQLYDVSEKRFSVGHKFHLLGARQKTSFEESS